MTRSVLIVDDDDDIRELAAMSLELVEWRTLQAASGPSCLEMARKFLPDAIVLDMMMPGMDGPATLQLLRQDVMVAHIPVVFLTAKTMLQDQRTLIGSDAAGVIAKPFDPMTLARQVAEILAWEQP